MQFPSLHQLRTAAQVLMIVGEEAQEHSDLAKSYFALASGGLYSASQLLVAEDWLVDVGILVRDGEKLNSIFGLDMENDSEFDVVREILRYVLVTNPPAWLGASFVDGVFRTEIFPGQAAIVLKELFLEEERDSILFASMMRYDDTRKQMLGQLGEICVVDACKEFHHAQKRIDRASQVRRVSEVSDAFGYDVVSPNVWGELCCLEVKCFSGPVPQVYLTRHEYEVGLRQKRWFLVVCQAVSDDKAKIVGWTNAAALRWRVPREVENFTEWHVIRVKLEAGQLNAGLPLGHH